MISEKWQFSAEIKKKYWLHLWRVQLPKWSMDVIWRLGTELRHFDQEIWGGNNCDMVVFTVDERRVEVVFFSPYLSVSIVHFTVNSFWQSLHLSLRCKLSRIQSNLNFLKKKVPLISSLFFTAQSRLNFIHTDSSFHVQKFHVIDYFWMCLLYYS